MKCKVNSIVAINIRTNRALDFELFQLINLVYFVEKVVAWI